MKACENITNDPFLASQQQFSSHNVSKQVLTCSELKTANIYWNIRVWALTARIPKIHELPRIGKRTATALAVSLKEKIVKENMMREVKFQATHQGIYQLFLGRRQCVRNCLCHNIPSVGWSPSYSLLIYKNGDNRSLISHGINTDWESQLLRVPGKGWRDSPVTTVVVPSVFSNVSSLQWGTVSVRVKCRGPKLRTRAVSRGKE